MKRVCAIVEGFGDVDAIPHLIAKIGAYHETVIVSPDPIRAGEWPRVKRAGELERLLGLAASRKWDQILIVLDLDDDCPVEEAALARERINNWLNGRDIVVSVVFFEREYETLFLHDPGCLGDVDLTKVPADPASLRDAKGPLKGLIGRRYKETSDQKRFTEKLSVDHLLENCRCFQKLHKEVSRVT